MNFLIFSIFFSKSLFILSKKYKESNYEIKNTQFSKVFENFNARNMSNSVGRVNSSQMVKGLISCVPVFEKHYIQVDDDVMRLKLY